MSSCYYPPRWWRTASGFWTKSTLTYHVSHPLHQSEGVSHAARGKGVCHDGQCDFLIAVPVKSFDSADSNRDLHMLQVTRGAQFPIVTVRTRVPESASASATINLDLEIQFAGQTVQYKQVPFQRVVQGKRNPDHRNNSGNAIRLQDRPTVAPNNSRQERNSDSRRYDVAAGIKGGLATP